MCWNENSIKHVDKLLPSIPFASIFLCKVNEVDWNGSNAHWNFIAKLFKYILSENKSTCVPQKNWIFTYKSIAIRIIQIIACSNQSFYASMHIQWLIFFFNSNWFLPLVMTYTAYIWMTTAAAPPLKMSSHSSHLMHMHTFASTRINKMT